MRLGRRTTTCLTCPHDAHILHVYLNIPSKDKACLKLDEASTATAHIRLVAMCGAMNVRALYVTINHKKYVATLITHALSTNCLSEFIFPQVIPRYRMINSHTSITKSFQCSAHQL